jgi:hypothetical protein
MVPQFIEVEDKIFGPVTSRQFIILLVGGLMCFISYKLADFSLFVVLLAVIGGCSLIFAFATINGQPFHFFLLNILQTTRRPSRRVWNKYANDAELRESIREGKIQVVADKAPEQKTASHTKIRDLSLMVNTGGYYKGDDQVF